MKIELDDKSVVMIINMLMYVDPTGFMFKRVVEELQAQVSQYVKKENVQIVQK
jgi:hypothetical protein